MKNGIKICVPALLMVTMASFFVITTSTLSRAGERSPQEKFIQANQFFEKGDLTQPRELYESLIAEGFQGPALYYNLGNLYYRNGERGKAVLWYERSFRLAPRDPDIQFNLTLAKSHIKDENKGLLEKCVSFFTPSELSFIFTFFLWGYFLIVGFRTRGWIEGDMGSQAATWVFGLCLLFFGTWFGFGIYETRQPFAIVTTPPGEVRNGPGTEYAVGFTIPEGSKVLVLNKRPEWTQVGVQQQGLKGWMPTQELELIEWMRLS